MKNEGRETNVEDTVVFGLINQTEKNDGPFRDFLDLRIIYRIVCPEGLVKVTDEVAEELGLKEAELYNLAYKNTLRLFPVIPLDLGCFTALTNGLENPYPYGAVYMLYKEVLDAYCDVYGTDDLTIVPSSKEEVLVMPRDPADDAEVVNVVRSINGTEGVCPDEIVLSGNAYSYNRNTGEYGVVFPMTAIN